MEIQNKKIADIRKDFAIFRENKYTYLDNSATSQRPGQVLSRVMEFYQKENANPFRGVYELSEICTKEYEDARSKVASFVGAKSSSEIVFTRNASESLNLIAYSYGMENVSEGDEIIVCISEHHSNFLPWKMIAEKKNANLIKLEVNDEGIVTEDALKSVISDKTKIVAMAQVSNVFGNVNDIKTLVKIAHEHDAIFVCDGAQSVPHMPVDVTDLDVDFMAFSGHKMMAPMGIGALYGKQEILEGMQPFLRGGEMIEIVHWDRVKYAQVPHKFEAGTVNTGGAVGLAAAIDYINSIGFDFIMEQEKKLTKLAFEKMIEIPHVNIIGSKKSEGHEGILTFTIDGVHPHDVASIFDSENICVRAGHHCAQPLMDFLGVGSTTRASLAFYNTEEEVEKFIKCLSGIRGKMGYAE